MNNYSIILNNCGKKFNREWIFRRLNYQFDIGKAYAITGHNGSGKSTLLQCIAGNMNFNEGNMQLPVSAEKHFQHLSVCTPYLELIEEMTGVEFLAFHSSFKPLTRHKTIDEILLQVGLSKAANKKISKYSSGMKQRLKLAQAIFSDTPLLLLDEPCTNLDKEGYALYQHLIQENCTNKIVIICSNEEAEIHFCNARIHINDYK